MKKILVTGANGFIGKNLIVELRNRGYTDIYEYDVDTNPELLQEYSKQCEFVFHLAGVNRPQNPDEFFKGNIDFTAELLENLKKFNNKSPVLITSSIQAELDNPYGKSKREAENLLFSYENETGNKTLVYRLPNVFGKWCKPNYNSVIATFCYNVANNQPLQVNNPDAVLNLVYIDDAVNEFINALEGRESRSKQFCIVPVQYYKKLAEIAALINSFRESRKNLSIPDISDLFTKKLYSTFISYLPNNGFSFPLKMNIDDRGSFTEIFKTKNAGQVSVNISKPGITKGNHWHHTKCEKFLVVSGTGVVKLRNINTGEITEYCVSGEKLEVIDIPPGYTHNITNTGNVDMVTIMWANEQFDAALPDTYFLEV